MKKQIKMTVIAAMAGIIGMIPCVGAAAQDNAAQNKDIFAAENIILIKNDDGTKYEAVYDFDTSGIPEGKKLTLIPDTVDKIGSADLSVHIGQDTVKKNDDVKITFTSTGFAGSGDYSVTKTINGYLSDDYKAYEIPVMSDLDFEYVLSEENKTITLTKYKGTDTEIVIYPQYHIGNPDSSVYDTVVGITKYGITDGGYGSDFIDGEYEGTNPDDITYTIGDGVFAGNTNIKSVTFLDGVKIGSHKDYMIQSDNIYAPDYEGGEYSYHGYRWDYDDDVNIIHIQNKLDDVDESGNSVYKDVDGRDTVTVIEGPDMKGMFTGCTSLVEVKNIPDDVVKMTNTFRGCKALTTVTNLPSKLLDMEKTFMDCESLAEVPQIPEKVVNMLGTFRDCKSLNPKTELRVPQTVRNLMETFENCNVMEKTPVVSSKTQVRNLFYTFYRCKKMEALPILPESAVSLFRTFYGCESATGVVNDTPHVIGNNKTTAPIDLIDTYRGCKALSADIYVDMSKDFVSNYVLGYGTGYGIKYNSAVGSSEVLNKSYEELFSDSTWLYNCYDYNKLLRIRQAEAEGKITGLYPGSSVESSRFEYDGEPGYNDGQENYIKAAYRQQVPKGMFWEAALAEDSQIKLHLPDSTDYNNNEYNFLNGGRSTSGADGATGETSMTVSKFTNLPELMGNEDDRVSEDTPQQYVTYTFNLSCHIEKRFEQLERIEISNPPDKTEYEDGEHFDPTGMVVTAIYREYVDDVPTDKYVGREVTDYTINKDGEILLEKIFIFQ